MEYEHLKSRINEIVKKSGREKEILETAKKNYARAIDSRRKFERIDSTDALLTILERRVVLSATKIEPLFYFTSLLDDGDTLHLLDSYMHEKRGVENERPDRPGDRSPDRMDAIREIVSEGIGSGWRNLARNLKLPEGELEIVDAKHGSDLKSKILETLKIFEDRIDPSKRVDFLCAALEKSRRKDLKNKILRL